MNTDNTQENANDEPIEGELLSGGLVNLEELAAKETEKRIEDEIKLFKEKMHRLEEAVKKVGGKTELLEMIEEIPETEQQAVLQKLKEEFKERIKELSEDTKKNLMIGLASLSLTSSPLSLSGVVGLFYSMCGVVYDRAEMFHQRIKYKEEVEKAGGTVEEE
jgi:CRISPR/Cas system CMR subunit Cmr6 (Cas7 group RAMP superfamily)